MDKRTIIFRADGGPNIGMGHFMRTLALSEMLKSHFYCIFAIRNPTKFQIVEIEKICHEYISLPEDNSHFPTFLNLLTGNEIVVLDNYYFNTEYQQNIITKGCKLVCIDDIHDKHFVSHIVINHAEGIDPKVYSIENYTKLLLGYKYALLRKEFRDRTVKENTVKKYACVIIMGGADPFNITSLLINALSKMKFDKPIAVIGDITSIQKNNTSILDNFIFFKNLTAREVSELMRASDFGILPASTVAVEACAVRLPFICGYFIDNQTEIYKNIKQNILAICVGNFIKLKKKKLEKAFQLIQKEETKKLLISNQKEKIDNHSNERFVNIFMKL